MDIKMAEETVEQKVARLKGEIANVDSPQFPSRWKSLKRKLYWGAGVATVAGAILGGLLTYDSLTKRQDYPVRNVLFKTTHTSYFAGNQEKKAAEKADQEVIIKINEGGGIESKVGTYLGESVRETRGDAQYFAIENSQKRRIAMATQKPERFQSGLDINGTMNYREEKAELLPFDRDMPTGTKSSSKYMVYKLEPERGWKQNDIDVIEFPAERNLGENEPGVIENDPNVPGKKDVRLMANHLVETRNAIGWWLGKNYRGQTLLEDFLATPKNKKLARRFFDDVSALSSSGSVDKSTRKEITGDMRKVEDEMDKRTIYLAYEDGYLKWLPLGSTVYLGEKPSIATRALNWLGLDRTEHTRLRVDSQWHFFPFGFGAGNYPILNKIPFGSGKDKSFPFSKYNNGGYTLSDKYGAIAQITIRDFLLNYGQDVLYSYYMDLNGNGKIDRPSKVMNGLRRLVGKPEIKETELIGEVICRFSHDEMAEIDKISNGIMPEADLTLNSNYCFSGPNEDTIDGYEHFKQCMYLESMLANQIHRGFGKHSLLGFINDQRSDIMSFKELSVENLSRSLTQESTLGAKYDIITVLNATKRPYAERIAKVYGIDEEFKGQYQKTPLTWAKPEFMHLAEVAGVAALAGFWWNRRRRKLAKK